MTLTPSSLVLFVSKAKASLPPAPTPDAPAKRETLLSKLKNEAGGISRMPTLDEVLDEITDADDYEQRPGAYHFSNLMRCFRWQWYKQRGQPCGHGLPVKECKTCRFDGGKSEPGHAAEAGIRKVYAQVLNRGNPDGPILNDMRFSIPIEVTWVEEEESQKKPGKYIARNKKQTVYLTGKSDTLIQGDNGTIIGFTELKTPANEFFPKKITKKTEAYGTKRLPLTLAGIQEPDNPDGCVSLHQLTQAGVGMKVLEVNGRKPETGVLQTVSRSNWRDHIEVVLTPEEWSFLYDLAVWYVKEMHINAQFDEPPAPEFFLGWECGFCSYAGACAEENKRTGQDRVIHPTVPGIQGRIEALHGEKPATDVAGSQEAKPARKGGKGKKAKGRGPLKAGETYTGEWTKIQDPKVEAT
jgi:hypothetical protein